MIFNVGAREIFKLHGGTQKILKLDFDSYYQIGLIIYLFIYFFSSYRNAHFVFNCNKLHAIISITSKRDVDPTGTESYRCTSTPVTLHADRMDLRFRRAAVEISGLGRNSSKLFSELLRGVAVRAEFLPQPGQHGNADLEPE